MPCAPAASHLSGHRRRPFARATSNVQDAHELRGFIDREEHAVDVAAPAVFQDANRLVAVEAFRRDSKSAWELLEERIARSRPLNQAAPWVGALSMTQRYSSSSSASAFFVTSTRYAMLYDEAG
jgi:hypothetical protein